MGTCVLPENFKELNYYYDEDKEIEEKRKKAQEKLNIYKQNQKRQKFKKKQIKKMEKMGMSPQEIEKKMTEIIIKMKKVFSIIKRFQMRE